MSARISSLNDQSDQARAELLELACRAFGDEILDETPTSLRKKAYYLLYEARVARIQRREFTYRQLVNTIMAYQRLARLLFDLGRV